MPSGLSRFSLKEEAQFYGIQKIVDLIEHDEKEKMAKSELPKTGKIIYCVLSLFKHELYTAQFFRI